MSLINRIASLFIWALTGRTEETQYQAMQRLHSRK